MRIKSTKYADMHAMDVGGGEPPFIHVATKQALTKHGELFHSLLVAVAPAAAPLVAKGEVTAGDIVHFCRDIVAVAHRMASGDKMLAMSVPPGNALDKLLKEKPDV